MLFGASSFAERYQPRKLVSGERVIGQSANFTENSRSTAINLGWWPELVASFLAVTGMLIGVLSGFHPREWQASASDLKTLYASALCFRQHLDPYDFHNIAAVFQANHVIPPVSWYAHAPVYPPFTLAVITPLTFIPMIQAVYLWVILTGVALALACFLLARAAAEMFLISRPWRLLLIALFAASPLLSFSVEMCNVSAVVSALCIMAVISKANTSRFAYYDAAALALGLLLKPHLAIWVVIALLISRSRSDRSLATRSLLVFGAVTALIAAWMAVHYQLLPELASYRSVVLLETAGGSMSPSNHELIAVAAQITSTTSLFGYWLRGWSLSLMSALTLVGLAGGLALASLRDQSQSESTRLLRITAWAAFGLVATYHRAHDGAFMLVLLPYLLARLYAQWRDPFVWSFVLLSVAMGLGPRWETLQWLASKPGLETVSNLMLYRQSTIATMLILVLLIIETWHSLARQQGHLRINASEPSPVPSLV